MTIWSSEEWEIKQEALILADIETNEDEDEEEEL